MSKSAFDVTNKKIRQLIRESLFGEARETIERYMTETVNLETIDINELSHIYLRYVILLSKQYELAMLGRVFLS